MKISKKSPLLLFITAVSAVTIGIMIFFVSLILQIKYNDNLAIEVSASSDSSYQKEIENNGSIDYLKHTFDFGEFVFLEVPGITLKTYSEQDGIYNIHVYYPQAESWPVNMSIIEFVETEVKNFKDLYDEGVLDIRFESHVYNQYIMSFVFNIYKSSGEENYYDVKTFSFDLMGGLELDLQQIFTKDAVFLPLISEKIKSEAKDAGLCDKYGEETVNKFISGDYENYSFNDEQIYFFINFDNSQPDGMFVSSIPISDFGLYWNVETYYTNYFRSEEDFHVSREYKDYKEDFFYPVDASNPPESGEEINNIIDIEFIKEMTSILDNKKYVALTFDDGPHMTNTPRLLDTLKQYNAKATFFLLGHRIPSMKHIIRRMYDEGHMVGNHTYNHKALTELSNSQIRSQIDQTNSIIEEITGQSVTLLRPPYGAKNDKVLNIAKERNMSIITWDIDPRDWEYFDPENIAAHIIQHAENGSIILLHDIYATSIDAAEMVIKALTDENFMFVTVEELLEITTGLEAGLVYKNGKGPVQ